LELYNIEAEEILLGSILTFPEILDEIDVLDEDFYRTKNKLIFQAILKLHQAGKAVNLPSVMAQLKQDGLLDTVDASFVTSLASPLCSKDAGISAAREVKELSYLRQLSEMGLRIKEETEKAESVDAALTKIRELVSEMETKIGTPARFVFFRDPRIIQTNPPRYEISVNGVPIIFRGVELLSWEKTKQKIMEKIPNIIPVRPAKDWDEFVHSLISRAREETAPIDASEEYQLKVKINKWFDQYGEAETIIDLKMGGHVIRNIDGVDHYFFMPTPLIKWLRDKESLSLSPEDLWMYVRSWGGRKHSVRIGQEARYLWGLPLNFLEVEQPAEKEKEEEKKEIPEEEEIPEEGELPEGW